MERFIEITTNEFGKTLIDPSQIALLAGPNAGDAFTIRMASGHDLHIGGDEGRLLWGMLAPKESAYEKRGLSDIG